MQVALMLMMRSTISAALTDDGIIWDVQCSLKAQLEEEDICVLHQVKDDLKANAAVFRGAIWS